MPSTKEALSPEAVQAIIAKEALLRAGVSTSGGMLISSYRRRFYVWRMSHWSDSATAHQPRRAEVKQGPFGDEESLKMLFAEFADEDRALANEGLAEFRQVMSEYDGE